MKQRVFLDEKEQRMVVVVVHHGQGTWARLAVREPVELENGWSHLAPMVVPSQR